MTTKVSFNGATRRITVLPGVTALDVKTDVYSEWKRWSQIENNLAFPPAIRVIGGDSIGGGQFAGDLYFLMNGWVLETDQIIKVNGALFHDDGVDPVLILPGGGYTASVSAIVQTVSTGEGTSSGSSVTPAQIWDHPTRTLTAIDIPEYPPFPEFPEVDLSSIPTTEQIALAVRNALLTELNRIDAAISSRMAAGSTVTANVVSIKNQQVVGEGTKENPWRPA